VTFSTGCSDRRRDPEGRETRIGRQRRRTAAFLVIGNEILSGKIADTNTRLLAQSLREKGIALRRVLTIPDEPEVIAAETADLAATHDFVFTSGGVGATHDDVTMEGIARAFATRVVHHPRFLEALRKRGLEATHRDLARVPEGAELREGRSGAWPVVVMRNVWILPGLPPVFERKLAILEERLPAGPAYFTDEELVPRPEESLIPLLDRVVAAYPEVQIGSYPVAAGTRITLDGDDGEAVANAAAALRDAVAGM
jgi:molybdenum cofactor synthesis domain-containing protein